MTAKQQYERDAANWAAKDKPAGLLLPGWQLFALRCWLFSDGGKKEGMSKTLTAFLKASDEALPEDWFDDMMDERDTCRRCSQTYRVENLMVCTHCLNTYCHRCMAGGERAANGNIACPCGGELVG